MFKTKVPVLEQKNNGCYQQLDLYCPEVAAAVQPGQFVTVSCGTSEKISGHILNRPFSIFRSDCQQGRISLLYQIVGSGTADLSCLQAGDYLNVLGPLGNGWSLPKPGAEVLVAAGGIGIAAVYQLLQELLHNGCRVTLLQAGRTAEHIIKLSDLFGYGELLQIKVMTDDGSLGQKGLITVPLAAELQHNSCDFLYACGPKVMLRAVCALARQYNISGEVSMEERMGCGLGACLSCVCRIRDEHGQAVYKRTCHDGPVFSLSEVIFDA